MTFLNHWLLTILLLFPAAGSVAVLFVSSARAVRRTALGIAFGAACISLLVLILFQRKPSAYDDAPAGNVQMTCSVEILPSIHWNYRVAVDGLSLSFVVVACLIGVLACAAAPHHREQARWFFAMLLWLETAALGVFISFDLLLLWTFLALSLVPCCSLLAMDDQERRGKAIAMFLIPMLIALACLCVGTLGERLMSTRCLAGGTLDLVHLASLRCEEPSLFLLMLIGFLALLPVFPLHAGAVAIAQGCSTATMAMVAGMTSLFGGYGLLRVVVPLFPNLAAELRWLPAGLGLLMILYCSLCAVGMDDLRSATFYVTLSVSSFALIGVATLTPVGLNGSATIWLSQSLLAPCLIGLTSTATRRAKERGELQSGLIACVGLVWLGELALPGLVGQIMVLLGTCEMAASSSSMQAYLVAGIMCLGTVLIAVAGVCIVRRMLQANKSGAAGPELSLVQAV